ncbi:unnamed protein product, partial [Polarella glacialis]
ARTSAVEFGRGATATGAGRIAVCGSSREGTSAQILFARLQQEATAKTAPPQWIDLAEAG